MRHAIHLLLLFVASAAVAQDTCFMVSAENLAKGPGNFYLYTRISDKTYTFQKGDKLEYDILLPGSNPVPKGGLDIEIVDGPGARDRDMVDQNGLRLHGDALLKPAVGNWYHRVFDLSPMAGTTSRQWNVAFEGDEPGRYIQFLDDIRVTHGGQTVLTIYDDGPAPPLQLEIREGYSITVLAVSLPRQNVLDNQTVKVAVARAERANKLARDAETFHAELDIARAAASHSAKTAVVDEAAALEDRAAYESGDVDVYHASVEKARAELQPLAADIRALTLYLVGHAHIDFQWLWTWDETVNEIIPQTFGQALKFLDEYPEFCFSQSSAGLYLPVEQKYPEMLKKIQKYVKEGRWELLGGRWTEADTNVISPESHVRHFLYTQKYFQREFGKIATVGWEPDTFGHTWQMPQLLKKAGIDSYYFCRAGRGQPMFWWEAPDGSKVLAFDNAAAGGWYNDPVDEQHVRSLLTLSTKTGAKTGMDAFGVGNHGGGPTREMIDAGVKMEHRDFGPTVKFGTARQFFDSIRKQNLNLPTIKNDLNSVFEGCYTTHSETKRLNRDSETLLEGAEVFSAIDSLFGVAYPRSAYEDLWRDVLWNHHHDTIGGSFGHPPSLTSRKVYHDVLARGGELLMHAQRDIASRIRSIGPHVVVFNPLAWERSEVVDAEVTLPASVRSVGLSDAAGEVKAQVLDRRVDGSSAFFRVCFMARGVPGCGYKAFRVVSKSGSAPAWNPLRDFQLDNQPAEARGQLEVVREHSTDMSAWTVGRLGETTPLGKPRTVVVVESGPVRRRVRSTYAYDRSTIIEDTITYPGQSRTDYELNVEWLEAGNSKDGGPFLNAAFPTTAKADTATYDIAFADIARKNDGHENAALKWVDLSDANGGVTVLNDCKNGYSVKDGVVRLSLLRASYDPDPTPDVGWHRIRYSAVPHKGSLDKAAASREGWEFNKPMQAVFSEANAKGSQPAAWSICSASPQNIIVTAVKRAEDGDAIIIRAYECAGRETGARFALGFDAKDVVETDLLEQPMPSRETNYVLSGRTLTAGFHPYEIRTFRLRR